MMLHNFTKWMSLALTLAALGFLASCRSAPEAAVLAPPSAPTHRPGVGSRLDIVHIGDMLDILVKEDGSLNGQFPVLESGNIIMPKIGRIYVAGSTLDAAQSIVRSRIQSEQIKQASVILERVRTSAQSDFADLPKLLIFMTGAVAKPGQHRVPIQSGGALTAFEAIMVAGGTTVFADQRRAYILRKTPDNTRVKVPFDLQAISKGEGKDVPVQDGDVIVVPQRRFGF